MIMASMAARFGKAMLNQVGSNRGFATSTAPKLKPFSATAENVIHRPKHVKADFMPLCMMLGLVVVATTIGAHTAKQQLMHSPNVHLRKKKREMVPEVYQPEQVMAESDKFLHNSFLRRVAHIQGHKPNPVPDPIRGNAFTSEKKLETLKSVGVDPNSH